MVSRPLVCIVLLSSVWLQVDALRKLVRDKRSNTVDDLDTSDHEHLGGSSASLDAASMDPDGANGASIDDADKEKLLSELHHHCENGDVQFIESTFSQHDEAVSKELLMMKANVWVYAGLRGGEFQGFGFTMLGVTMKRLCENEYTEFSPIADSKDDVKQVMLFLIKLHLKYDVPLDAQFNGFYQLDPVKDMDLNLYLQEAKLEYMANSLEQVGRKFEEEKHTLELGGTFLVDPDVWTWKFKDATGKTFHVLDAVRTPNYDLVNDIAFPVAVELVVRNRAR